MSTENNALGGETPTTEAGQPIEQETVETGNEEAKATVEGEPEPDKKTDEGEKEKPKPKNRAQERIEQLARDKRNLQRQLNKRNQEVGRLRAEAMPREEDYADHTSYQADVIDRRLRENAVSRDIADLGEQERELRNARNEAFAERLAEAAIPGFNMSAFFQTVPITEPMADVIANSEVAAHLADYLSKNLAEAHRIAAMSPIEQAAATARLEARVVPPKPKHISSAPKPVTTIGGQAHPGSRSPDQMSMQEYRSWREAQIKARDG
jgi:hypothetical protein